VHKTRTCAHAHTHKHTHTHTHTHASTHTRPNDNERTKIQAVCKSHRCVEELPLINRSWPSTCKGKRACVCVCVLVLMFVIVCLLVNVCACRRTCTHMCVCVCLLVDVCFTHVWQSLHTRHLFVSCNYHKRVPMLQAAYYASITRMFIMLTSVIHPCTAGTHLPA